MEPISPVLAEHARSEVTFGSAGKQAPAIRSPEGIVLLRWRATAQERAALAAGADVLLSVATYNQPLMLMHLEVEGCGRTPAQLARDMGLPSKPPSVEELYQALEAARKATTEAANAKTAAEAEVPK